MTILNGRLPLSMLVPLPWEEADHLYLRADAALWLGRLAEAFEAHFGKPLYLSDAYRTYAQQVILKAQKGRWAATPGTSNHGWGIAIDAASRVNVDGSAEHRWFEEYAAEYGWENPAWAVDYYPGNGEHEPWHWEFIGAPDTEPAAGGAVTTTPAPAPLTRQHQEDDMLLITARGGVWTLQGSTLTGLGTMDQAHELASKGVPWATYNDADFDRLRADCAGRDLIHNPAMGYAVGTPGGKYRGLADMAEVNYHRNAGCRDREVSEATMRNLTA